MPIHRFDVVMQLSTGLPEDVVVNTWHFDGNGTDFDNVRDMLADFYTATPPDSASSVSSTILSPGQLQSDLVAVRGYDLSMPKPRVPVYESEFEMTGSVGGGMPWEVAMVLSFQGERVSGVNQARRRNRKYLGPVRASAVDSQGMFTANAVGILAAAAGELLAASNASVGWTWVAYSTVASTGTPVVGGWVDNAPDIQRRRGRAATERPDWDENGLIVPAP